MIFSQPHIESLCLVIIDSRDLHGKEDNSNTAVTCSNRNSATYFTAVVMVTGDKRHRVTMVVGKDAR